MTRRIISICYKIFTAFSLAMGIILNVTNTRSVTSLLSYYTLQSNIICFAAFVTLVYMEITKKEKTDTYYLCKGAIIIAIIITAIVYRFALAPNSFQMDSLQTAVARKALANLLVHTVSPMLVVGDYMFFDTKGNFKYYYPVAWLVIPFNYVCYVYTYSSIGGRFYNIGGSKYFAYFFLDYQKIGYRGVCMWIIAIACGIIAISYMFVWIDSRLAKVKKREKMS